MTNTTKSAVQTVSVAPDEADLRLDRWFKRRYPALTHGRLEKLLRTGQVRVDGRRAKASLRLAAGQVVRVPPLDRAPSAPRAQPRPPADPVVAAWLRDLILFEDDEVIAINKPPGLPVQGGTKSERNLDAMLGALAGRTGEPPRLVHRLDKDTSGVLLLARSAKAAASLTAAFRRKTTEKLYWALVVGVPEPKAGRIDLAVAKLPGPAGERMVPVDPDDGAADGLDAKRAVTLFAVVDQAGGEAAWLALKPLTGRTHQLRVHAAALGTPILGDGKYGGKAAFLQGHGLSRKLHLHARRIVVPRPNDRPGGGAPIDVTAPLPDHMRETWRFFGFDPDMAEDPFEAES